MKRYLRPSLIAWVVMGLIVAAGFQNADSQRDGLRNQQRRLDEALVRVERLAEQVANESENRGVAGCKAIVTIRNALVGATAASDRRKTAEEERRQAEGLRAFDGLLQPALDELCPGAGITLEGGP